MSNDDTMKAEFIAAMRENAAPMRDPILLAQAHVRHDPEYLRGLCKRAYVEIGRLTNILDLEEPWQSLFEVCRELKKVADELPDDQR